MDRTRPEVGVNLVSWSAAENGDAEPWQAALDGIAAVGIRRVTLIAYRFVDPRTGRITRTSGNGLVAGPTDAVLQAVAGAARTRGLDAAVVPFVEVDDPAGIGRTWRGTLTLSDAARAAFFAAYQDYVLEAAGAASRLSIGSELAGLSSDRAAEPYWERVIAAARRARPDAQLTYAANFDEADRVPFWGGLDEIGVDAYFPLASPRQARGPDRPSAATLARGWTRILRRLRGLSRRAARPVTIAEWGTVPLDLTTTRPWDWRPSDVPDPMERANAYRALLRALPGAGDWLTACDLWHWRMPGTTGSAYGIDQFSDVADDIRAYVAEGPGIAGL